MKKTNRVETKVRLPKTTVALFERVAKMSGVTRDDVINVVLSFELIKWRGQQRTAKTKARAKK